MKYFKTEYGCFMVSRDSLIRVGQYPNSRFYIIETRPNLEYYATQDKTPISETEFKNEFLRVSLLIEETINN